MSGLDTSGAMYSVLSETVAFNLVVCRAGKEKSQRPGATASTQFLAVYRYFEKLTGNRGITITVAEGLGESRSIVAAARGEVIAVKENPPGTGSGGERMFASAALRTRIEGAGIGTSALRPLFVVLKTGN
jgi:hypothetical protein